MDSHFWMVLIPFSYGMDGCVLPWWDLCWGRACRANLDWLQAVTALPTWVLLLCYAESFCVSHCMEVVSLGVSAVVLNHRDPHRTVIYGLGSPYALAKLNTGLGVLLHRFFPQPCSAAPTRAALLSSSPGMCHHCLIQPSEHPKHAERDPTGMPWPAREDPSLRM